MEKDKKDKTITTTLKSFDILVIIATTSSSITLSLAGIGLIAIPISSSVACGLINSNKVLNEIIVQKYNKYNKEYEKNQQTIKSFDKIHRKYLQDNAINESEYESLCNIFTKFLEETKNEIFL